jgi:hypothetical protein
MTTLEDIEKVVTELPADQLARFRAWFEEFEAAHSTRGSSGTPRRAGSASSPSRCLRISVPVARASCETFAGPSFWGSLCAASGKHPSAGRQELRLLKANPRHRSLQLKKVGRFWSVRVGSRYRALAVEADAGLPGFWIGSHADYDAMI